MKTQGQTTKIGEESEREAPWWQFPNRKEIMNKCGSWELLLKHVLKPSNVNRSTNPVVREESNGTYIINKIVQAHNAQLKPNNTIQSINTHNKTTTQKCIVKIQRQ
jgi:hypothetical protein